MLKFWAVSRDESVSIDKTVLRSAWSRAESFFSSSCDFASSSESAAIASWADCCPMSIAPSAAWEFIVSRASDNDSLPSSIWESPVSIALIPAFTCAIVPDTEALAAGKSLYVVMVIPIVDNCPNCDASWVFAVSIADWAAAFWAASS